MSRPISVLWMTSGLGCDGDSVALTAPIRGWVDGLGGCPNVGGICIACTMPGFPDKYMPFGETDAASRLYAAAARYSYGPVLRYLRERRIRRTFDVEPKWRRRGASLSSGYTPR